MLNYLLIIVISNIFLINWIFRTLNDVMGFFKEMKPEFIRTSLKKIWIEDFYIFCTTQLNNTTVEIMDDLLKFEADFKTI